MPQVLSIEVIIPVYNDQKGVNACIAAIDSQYSDVSTLEITVVDNGSSVPIVIDDNRNYPVSVIHCAAPGSYAARNAGAHGSDADVLVFLDADCVPADGWLRHGLDVLTGSTGDVVVGGEVLYFRSLQPTATETYQLITGFGQTKNINHRKFTATANLFVKRTVFEKVGPFDAALLSGGDREWCWRAGAAGFPVIFAPDSVVRTAPRREFRKAVVQARRVAGGRYSLESTESVDERASSLIAAEKGVVGKLRTILDAPDFSLGMKLRVTLVAACLMVARSLEKARLMLGGRGERR